MVKRKRSDSVDDVHTYAQSPKRSRAAKHHLMNFTDETILRVLSFLDIGDLINVQRSSQRLQRLANDNSIWREKYYERWVHHRARRLPGTKAKDSNPALRYALKLANWLNQNHVLREDEDQNWKRQYKIRANWWRGKCRMRELDVASTPAAPVLVKIHKGLIITADEEHGLRVWSRNLQKNALAARSLDTNSRTRIPSALAVDAARNHEITILVGFSDGSFDILGYTMKHDITLLYSHTPATQLTISACAISHPHVLTMSDGRLVSLYQLLNVEESQARHGTRCDLLTSLSSEATYSPVSLSIRRNAAGLIACVAYVFCRLNLGWSLGLQELRLDQQGDLMDCRLTVTADSSENITKETSHLQKLRASTRSAYSQTFTLHPSLMNRPSSISYSHPYLTASLPDNTLIVYLVNSDAASLEINAGRRLWGHTSSISGVEVDHRGKAVSISTKGNEIRVWELEDVLSSTSQKRSSIRIDPVQNLNVVADALAKRGNGLGLAVRAVEDELAITRSWVGFDDEQVVVLGEESSSRQMLSCYDFT